MLRKLDEKESVRSRLGGERQRLFVCKRKYIKASLTSLLFDGFFFSLFISIVKFLPMLCLRFKPATGSHWDSLDVSIYELVEDAPLKDAAVSIPSRIA